MRVCPYVTKGLWREEILYAKHMLDQVIRGELMKMLNWYVGVNTGFSGNPGKFGKYMQRCLEPELWASLLQTYADADYSHTWNALFAACDLFRTAATRVAEHFGYEFPRDDDRRVRAPAPRAAIAEGREGDVLRPAGRIGHLRYSLTPARAVLYSREKLDGGICHENPSLAGNPDGSRCLGRVQHSYAYRNATPNPNRHAHGDALPIANCNTDGYTDSNGHTNSNTSTNRKTD